MSFLKPIFNYYIFLNIHVGITTVSLTVMSMRLRGVAIDYTLLWFVFFSSVFTYHLIRVLDNCQCSWMSILESFKTFEFVEKITMLISLLGILATLWQVGVQKLWILTPAFFLVIGYSLPLVKWGANYTSLRKLPRLKLLTIAITWSIVTVLFPLQDKWTDPNLWLTFIQRIFLIMALVIPFDIGDMVEDSKYIQTLPLKLGVKKVKKLGISFLLVFFFLSFLIYPIQFNELFSNLFLFVISLFFIINSRREQSKYYASFWVESIPTLGLFFSLFIDFL